MFSILTGVFSIITILTMCPLSDSRQIYKNQFDKKEKEEKKKICLQKNHSPTPILFRFFPFFITK
ncbi:hypothetical protein K020075H21_41490 [Bacteroides ovatus]